MCVCNRVQCEFLENNCIVLFKLYIYPDSEKLSCIAAERLGAREALIKHPHQAIGLIRNVSFPYCRN